ncbi:hypothetical protein [Providencia stuartii]|uniref:hypothetical protein n=1 Tax=Providencia stuartii TaxID=588 RepID=UPI00111DC7BE
METYIVITTSIIVCLIGLGLAGFVGYALREGNISGGTVFGGMCCGLLILFYVLGLGGGVGDEEKGRYYATQCQLIEKNIDNGVFQSNTNKLKCGEVIENVTVSDYQADMAAYEKSQVSSRQ